MFTWDLAKLNTANLLFHSDQSECFIQVSKKDSLLLFFCVTKFKRMVIHSDQTHAKISQPVDETWLNVRLTRNLEKAIPGVKTLVKNGKIVFDIEKNEIFISLLRN